MSEQMTADIVLEALDHIATLRPRRGHAFAVKPSTFQGAEPLHEDISAIQNDDVAYFNPLEVDLDALSKPFNVSYLSGLHHDADRSKYHGWYLGRLSMASKEDLRGRRVRWSGGPVIRFQVMSVEYSGRGASAVRLIDWRSLRWDDGSAVDDEFYSVAKMAMSVQFTREHEWRVNLGVNGGASLALQTDPEGVLAAFRMRDVPDGKKRREALIHWVREHWRQRRRGGESKVREHLRGQTRFSWFGLDCRVVPPAVDAKRLGRRDLEAA